MAAERIEAKSIDKGIKLLKYLGLALALLGLAMVSIEGLKFRGVGELFDKLLFVVIGVSLFSAANSKKSKERLGQFFEWQNNVVKFRLKGHHSEYEIHRNEIKNALIHLDNITLDLIDGRQLFLDISDFKKYEDRVRIKSNFEALTKN